MAIPFANILGFSILTNNLQSFSIILGLITLVFGVLVIWKPKIIAYLIGIYFILIGFGLLKKGIGYEHDRLGQSYELCGDC